MSEEEKEQLLVFFDIIVQEIDYMFAGLSQRSLRDKQDDY